jgi:protein-tyrosine phosphatase
MADYVDIHSHVLYGLDDGAETLEDSLAMLEIARTTGTSDIVCTPHANSRYRFDPDIIEQRIAELAKRTDVRIHRGCDFHLHVSNIQDALTHPQKYTIDHGNYLLVELPESTVFSSTDQILLRLLDRGMVPIITHPERNAQLQRQLEDLAKWVELGCYVQITAASVTGLFGKRAKTCALDLVKLGLAHFVASDAHDPEIRTPNLHEAYISLADVWGENRIRPMFVDNPRAVLAGDTIESDLQVGPVKNRKWYQFWAL